MKPVLIADTCIGGLSVVKSMWNSGSASAAVFLADYAINPLGTKGDAAIGDVVGRWLKLGAKHTGTLVIACNTLSIRYHQLLRSDVLTSGRNQIVSMVDCFEAMVSIEADRLKDRKILVVGTEFTANQSLYSDILKAAVPGARVDTIAATNCASGSRGTWCPGNTLWIFRNPILAMRLLFRKGVNQCCI